MFHQPMSSPQRIRMLGFFAAMMRSFWWLISKPIRVSCARRDRVRFLVGLAIAVAEAEFLTAAARTGVIRPAPRVVGRKGSHYLGGRSTPLNQFGHDLEL